MARTPYKIILKRSSVAGKAPQDTDLEIGEVAVNLTDRVLYTKNNQNIVVRLSEPSVLPMFDIAANYVVGDFVVHNKKIYTANVNVANGPFDPDEWDEISPSPHNVPPYDGGKTYVTGDSVVYQGKMYFANVDINAPEPWDPTKWDLVGTGSGTATGDITSTPAVGVNQTITSADPADVPLTLAGIAGQTANLFQAGNFKVDKDGGIIGSGTDVKASALADNLLADAKSLVTRERGDRRYVRLTGGTLTGKLTLDGNPTAALHAATKGYVDNRSYTKAQVDAGFLPISGGTMQGGLELANPPSNDMDAANKKYIDDQVIAATQGGLTEGIADARYLRLNGGTMGGLIKFNLFSGISRVGTGGIGLGTAGPLPINDSGASTDGLLDLGSSTKRWRNGFFSGNLQIGNATAGNHALNRTTADARYAAATHSHSYLTQSAADARYLRLTGGTLTGMLVLPSTVPSNNNHAANKKYVDDRVATRLTQATADGRYYTKTTADSRYVKKTSVTVSTASPSGGVNGDIWFKV